MKAWKFVLGIAAAVTVTAGTAEASDVIKEQTLTNQKVSGTVVIRTLYTEDGLIEKIIYEDSSYELIPVYTFDEKGNITDFLITYQSDGADTGFELRLDNTYDADALTAVTGKFYDMDGEEISDEKGVPDDAFAMIVMMQDSLLNNQGYSDCSVTLPGIGTGFTKEEGELRTLSEAQGAGQVIAFEYDEENHLSKVSSEFETLEATITFTYDETGRVAYCEYKDNESEEAHEITYSESADEEGNTVFTDTEEYGFKYVYDESGALISCSQRVTGAQTDFCDGEGRLVRREISYGGTVPGKVTEYEYY